MFYVPDVVAIPRAAAALGGADVYIGDGATLTRPILRRRNGRPIGHIAIRDQLAWCARHGVPRAIFTHCGSQLVRSDARRVAARVRALGEAVGVRAEVAHDGLRVRLRGRRH